MRKRNNSSHNGGLIQKLRGARVIIAVALMIVLIKACYNNEANPPRLVSTSEVVNQTNQLIGKTVTIKGKPVQIIGASSFTVSDRQFFSGVPILVVNASAEPIELPSDRGTNIQVTGIVRNLVIPEIEREFHLHLQKEYYKDYINKPAIIAKSILLAPTLSQITKNPDKYYGMKLALTGKVENIQSPVLFTLDDGQWWSANLLVLLNAMPTMAINQGQTIEVIGVVRPFVVSDIERDYKTTWNIMVKSQLNAKYANKPVFVAEAVNDFK